MKKIVYFLVLIVSFIYLRFVYASDCTYPMESLHSYQDSEIFVVHEKGYTDPVWCKNR